MSTDTARQAELRRQIAEEMKNSLGLSNPVNIVQSALENSLDMHNAHIEEENKPSRNRKRSCKA